MIFCLRNTVAASIVVVAGAAVHAATIEDTYYVPLTDTAVGSAGLTTIYGSIYGGFGGYAAGSTFVETFLFATQPIYSVTYATFFSQYTADGRAEMSFTSLILADAPEGDPVVTESFITTLTPGVVRGFQPDPLTAGTYYLQLTGTLLTADAAFGGMIANALRDDPTTVSAVPEPTVAWLLGAGFAAMALLQFNRRRGIGARQQRTRSGIYAAR